MSVIGKKKRLFIWTRDGGICHICGFPVPLHLMSVDHDKPRSKGGTNEVENLKTSHSACNNKRGNGDPPPPRTSTKKKWRQGRKRAAEKRRMRWEAGSEGYTEAGRPRGPVMSHITNDNTRGTTCR